MAKITTITNPLTGQPAQVDQLDHTAQEIDDAIARSLPGGDIDIALQKKVNPNLLDNWYFGNPVDQRGGYVVPPGTKYYIYGASTASGTTSAYVTVKKLTDQTAYFDIDGTEYVCAPKFCVRGYTGEGYGIDRWISHGGGLLLNDGYITFIGYGKNLDQIADKDVYKQLRGKTVTISVLGRGYFSIVSEDYANNYNAKYVNSGEFTICSFALTVRSDADRFVFHIQPQDENPCDIVAVKLELGSQQTLAHQDADGNWLLNEIPDYGEQLRRCQRYFIRIGVPAAQGNGAIGFVNCATDTLANTCINTPVTMRATPTATLKNIVLRKGITDFGVTGCNIFAITQNGIYMNFVSSGLTTGDTILIRTVNGGCIDFTADL